jgi:Phage gp6-like head-tail connector protein
MMIDDLKTLLGIEDSNDQDDLLESLLISAQEYCEEYLKRPILETQDIEQVFLGYRQETLDLNVTPVVSVDSIVNTNGDIIDETSYKVINSLGMVRRVWGAFVGDLIVTYTGGYSAMPTWASKAIVYTAAALYNEVGSGLPTDGMVKSEDIPGVAKVTYETGTGVTGDGDYGPIPAIALTFLNSHRVSVSA